MPAAMFAGCKALLEVVNQGRVWEGVGLGVVGDPSLLGMGAVFESLLLMLQVLICSLGKDAHHLPVHLSIAPAHRLNDVSDVRICYAEQLDRQTETAHSLVYSQLSSWCNLAYMYLPRAA